MTYPRNQLVPPGSPGTYHCVSRCVRRAFLCGEDHYSGQSFEHRRQWIEDRLQQLAEVFAVSLWAYAVMSNHLHVVVQVLPEVAARWTDEEVAQRWIRLFPKAEQDMALRVQALMANPERLAVLRARLSDLSWFMRCLSEPIARRANAEDQCKGRFWEGRFKSQALLDETALLRCMSYVDLNPIRAGMAKTPEGSDYTAVQRRIRAPENNRLMPFSNHLTDGPTIPFAYRDYLELVDWSGRILTAGKQGAIPEDMPLIVQRLKLDPSRYADYIRTRPGAMPNALGPVDALRRLARSFGLKFIHGVSGRHCVTMAPA